MQEAERSFSAQSWLLSESTVPGLVVRTPRVEPHCCQETSQLSGCLQVGRGQEQAPLGPQPPGLVWGGQWDCPVVCSDGVCRRRVG